LIILSVAALDQLTKWWAIGSIPDGQSIPVLGSFFMLTLVYNDGGALGTSFGPSLYYLIASILILLFVFYYIYLNRNRAVIAIPLSFIAGGAIGNIIDRISLGSVIDFLDVDFFDISMFGYQLKRWWTFNLADSAISCSIVFLVVYMIFIAPKQNTPPAENTFPGQPESSESQSN
jgi:signal peptidase II